MTTLTFNTLPIDSVSPQRFRQYELHVRRQGDLNKIATDHRAPQSVPRLPYIRQEATVWPSVSPDPVSITKHAARLPLAPYGTLRQIFNTSPYHLADSVCD